MRLQSTVPLSDPLPAETAGGTFPIREAAATPAAPCGTGPWPVITPDITRTGSTSTWRASRLWSEENLFFSGDGQSWKLVGDFGWKEKNSIGICRNKKALFWCLRKYHIIIPYIPVDIRQSMESLNIFYLSFALTLTELEPILRGSCKLDRFPNVNMFFRCYKFV